MCYLISSFISGVRSVIAGVLLISGAYILISVSFGSSNEYDQSVVLNTSNDSAPPANVIFDLAACGASLLANSSSGLFSIFLNSS